MLRPIQSKKKTMKKLVSKLPKRLQPKSEETPPSRITNETVAEHRERILAGGRKFKYPVQYARHKLVFNALIITVAAALLLGLLGWWQLYVVQNSSAFMYRITRILPVPVAAVDSEQVPYRDYLLQYRGSEYYLEKYGEIKLSTEDGRRQLDYIKRQSLDKAQQVAYARMLGREKGITVSSADVDAFIDQERNTANGRVSLETYNASIKMLYDQDTDDYRLSVANGILKTKVAFVVDTNATKQADTALTLAKNSNGDFAKAAEELATSQGAAVVAGQSGMVDVNSKYGGLRVSEVSQLNVGQLSDILRTTTDDGYYIVKLMNKTDTQVDFTYIHIPLSTFENDFAKLKKDGKITEFVKLANT